ncbi:MAG TPA: hypothetical protein VJ654_15375 [Noviherbaspirillum sp.]|nr:hypothetical protein [Noviherbaspirillum sp.]
MAQQPKHWMDEPDIGSGEKSPGQEDVERDAHKVGDATGGEGRILRNDTHLARILATKQPDGQYEAQVFVRLTREPEDAETYIPAGLFPTESDAWHAAEERAQRAFREHEF